MADERAEEPQSVRRADDQVPRRADEPARPERDRPARGRPAHPPAPRRRAVTTMPCRTALPPAGAAPPPAAGRPAAADARRRAARPRTCIEIKSPTLGTFYARPKPGRRAVTSRVGSASRPTTVVGLIEAMKIFNEITADCTGVIAEILVENQQPVEYGQVLFRVDPTA